MVPVAPRRARPARRLRSALTGALLLPFLLVSMLAAGTMPVRGDRGVEIVICLGDSLATITVPADEALPGQAPEIHSDCPWDHAAQPPLAAAPTIPPLATMSLSVAAYPPAAAPRDIRARIRQVSNWGPPAAV